MRRGSLLALAVGWLCGCSAASSGPPNLLLITVDTLRADRLACYGGPADSGVAICGLARRGTRFVWAFSTAPSTSPSVASLLTSLWAPQHAVTQNVSTVLADPWISVAEALRPAGYATAAVVSNPMLHRRRRLDQGFERYDDRMTRHERNRRGFAERDARSTTDAALHWAGEMREPWFLWVHYQDPHGPYDPPGAPPAHDRPGARRLPPLRNNSGRGGIPGYQQLPDAFAEETYEQRYLAEIGFLDREVARLVEGLDGLGRPPAVLLTADHGEAFGEDGYYFAHGQSVGLDQVRVPLLFRPPPGSVGAGSVQQSVSLVDVAPTLLRLAGVEPPAQFVGLPLPVLAGDPPAAGRAIFAEAGRQAAVVRDRDYYARDLDPGATQRADGHRWGDEDPELPPRTARLGAGPGLPPYRAAATPPPALEPALSAFLAQHPQAPPDTSSDEPPQELVEQLRALGYDGE